MDPDLSRLPTGTAGWCALVDHALALGDLSEVDWLELKGDLPFGDKSDRKRSAVVVARAALGLSNRMPDTADKHMGGHGVVLVGLLGQQVSGADEVDGAVLHDALQPYLGDGGPRWDYVYINHPDGLVLAVVVDPPHWGDRIHACRKEYSAADGNLSVRDGDVFVRVPGKTRPATSHDLAALELRRDRAPSRGAQVSVRYGDSFDRVDRSSVEQCVGETIDQMAEGLLAGVTSSALSKSRYGAGLGMFVHEDQRSPDEFRRSVEAWRASAQKRAEGVATEFLRHELARGVWRVANDSDRYLEAVRVQIQFPPTVAVLMRSDTDYCDHGGPFNPRTLLPDPPVKWGNMTPSYLLGVRPLRADVPPAFDRNPEFEVAATDLGSLVTWHVGDLRPRSPENGGESFAVFTDDHLEDVTIHWTVTARGVDHVFEGHSSIGCAQESAVHLTWRQSSAPSEP